MADGDEEEVDESKSFDELRAEVEAVLDRAKSILEEQIELETALLDEGPGIISDLSGILLPIMRPIAVPVSYSTDVERAVNNVGVQLLDGKVLLFLDGNMYAKGLKPKPGIDFTAEFLQSQPCLDSFLRLLEDLVQHFADAVEKIDQSREAGINRIEAMKAKLKDY